MTLTRRNLLAGSAVLGAGLLAEHCTLAQLLQSVVGEGGEFAAPGEFKVKYYGQFSELPIGSVKARGWIAGWLGRQVEGMTGHPENLGYPYNTCMFGGKIPPPEVKHGDEWWCYEQSGYFFDGSVRLGLLSDDAAAKKIPEAMMQYVLANSGPNKIGESSWGWPNVVAGRALMAEYSATGAPAPAEVLRNYLLGMHVGGGRDGVIAEEALYVYGLTGDARLREIAEKSIDRYFLSEPKSFSYKEKLSASAPLHEHGVTAAEQLKLLPIFYSYTGDEQALKLAHQAYEKIASEDLMPDGGVVSSEFLGKPAFDSLHETCDITDWSWSFGSMLMATGEGRWADRIERATFNALPGAVTKDFKQLQYFSSANQVLASSTACTRIAMTRMSYRAAHETECCTGNVNRAMPNYVTRMWMRAASDDGVAAVLYGPSELRTKINGLPVQITEATEYPFRDTVQFTVKLAQAHEFSLHLRIPEWCSGATIAVNGRPTAIHAAAGGFAVVRRAFRNGDTVTLRLPMAVATERWFDGAATVVRRGPLVFSLAVDERRVESTTEPEAIRRVLKGNQVAGFPAVEFFPQGEWRYGIDAALAKTPAKIQVTEAPVGENPFLAASAPVKLTLPLHGLPGWAAEWRPVIDPAPENLKDAAKNPTTLPSAAESAPAAKAETRTLVPYGATHLRITTLPVIG